MQKLLNPAPAHAVAKRRLKCGADSESEVEGPETEPGLAGLPRRSRAGTFTEVQVCSFPLLRCPREFADLTLPCQGAGEATAPPPLFLNQLPCHPPPAPGCSQANELRRAFEACNGAKDCLSRVVQALGGRFKKVHVSRQLAAMGLAKGKFTPDQVCVGGWQKVVLAT